MNTRKDEHHEWTERFSAYLDGDLGEEDFRSVEVHLAECGACRRVLEDLRDVIARAGALEEVQPPRDLWGGIAATIQAPAPRAEHDAKVIALPTSAPRGSTPAPGARVSFSRPQLIAATVALIAASSLATWAAGPGSGVRSGPLEDAPAAGSPFIVEAAVAELGPPEGLAEELQELEGALRSVQGALDPNTVRVLERNLLVIEQAIDDSRRALVQDPGNAFLSAHLERVYQRKLEYLRDAARVAEWSD